jgi:hypothetical protein
MIECKVRRVIGGVVIKFKGEVTLFLQGDDMILFEDACGVETASDADQCPDDYYEQALRDRQCRMFIERIQGK